MDGRWDPIITCGVTDPQDVATCLGHTKANNRCKTAIFQKSRNDASHLLQLLAQRPAGHDPLPTLIKVAKNPLAKLWYDAACSPGMGLRQQLVPNSDRRRIGSRSNPVDLTATPLAPIEIERSAPQSQPVSVETLRRKQVLFEVFPDSPARVKFETWDGNDTSAILRSLSQGASNSDTECSICHGTSAEDTVYLKCEQCRTKIHLQCMESWLEARSTSINFDCPMCREHRWFDAIHSAPVARRRRRTASESPGETITAKRRFYPEILLRKVYVGPAGQGDRRAAMCQGLGWHPRNRNFPLLRMICFRASDKVVN